MAIEYKRFMLLALPLLFLVLFAHDAFALSNQSGPGLPGENSLLLFRTFVLGPVGFSLSLLGIIALGYAITQGGEMGGMMRFGIFTIIGIGFILGAAQVVGILFPGATIGENEAELILRAMGVEQ